LSWAPTLVTLVNGELVQSDAEEWRHECEAKGLLRYPPLARAQMLRGIADKRGAEAAGQLVETMRALLEAKATA
jgi:hypothetical protein